MRTRHLNKAYILLFILLLAAPALHSQQEVVDRVVAVVGREPIFLSDLNSQIELYTFTNRVDPNTPGLREQVLEVMSISAPINFKLKGRVVTLSENKNFEERNKRLYN